MNLLNTEAVRTISILAAAALAILAVFGVYEGSVVEVLTQTAIILGAGQAARNEVWSRDSALGLVRAGRSRNSSPADWE